MNPLANWRQLVDNSWQYHHTGYAVYATVEAFGVDRWRWEVRTTDAYRLDGSIFVDYYELVVAAGEDQVREIWLKDGRNIEDINVIVEVGLPDLSEEGFAYERWE